MTLKTVEQISQNVFSGSDDLPEGWSRVKLPEIADITMGQSPPGSTYNSYGEGLPFFQGKADFHQRYPTPRVWCTEPRKTANKGDVLISVRAPVGPTNIAEQKCIIGRGLAALTPLGGIPSELLLFALRFLEPQISICGTGSTFTAISKKDLEGIEISLPPLEEQKRIVAKVEELLARVNVVRERLAKVKEILKRFRQSVLAAACSGRLTADWRNKNPNVESAKEMMENLLQIQGNALKTKNEEFDLKTLREKFGYLAKDNQRFASSGDIPDKWVSASFYNLCILQRGFDLPTQKRHPGKYPIVSSSGISGSHNKAKVKGPCVCVGRSGSVGKTYYVEEDAWPLNTTLYVKEFNGNYPKFVYYYLFYMELEKFSSSTAVPTLNRNTFTFEEVNIPPVKEQKEIARRLDSVFKITDSVMNRKTTAIEQIERLEQSILSKAFRGELVTTEAELARNEDRSYEPASALLERVRRERMTPKTSRPKRGKKHISKAKRMDKRNGKLSRFVKLKAFSVLGHNAVHLLGQIEEEIGDREFSIATRF